MAKSENPTISGRADCAEGRHNFVETGKPITEPNEETRQHGRCSRGCGWTATKSKKPGKSWSDWIIAGTSRH